jgi:hypothetical protein
MPLSAWCGQLAVGTAATYPDSNPFAQLSSHSYHATVELDDTGSSYYIYVTL